MIFELRRQTEYGDFYAIKLVKFNLNRGTNVIDLHSLAMLLKQ